MNKQLLLRLGFIFAMMFIGVLSNSPTFRIVIGATMLLISLLMIALTLKKPKYSPAVATIVTVYDLGSELAYKLRFFLKDLERVPEGCSEESFYVETPRYDKFKKAGSVGDRVEAGWYEYTKTNGEKELRCVIVEKGFRIHAAKFIKAYILAFFVGFALSGWGIYSLIHTTVG